MIKIKPLEEKLKSYNYTDMREAVKGSAELFSDDIAFIIKHKVKKEVNYENITFKAVYEHMNCLGSAMTKQGLAGKRVAIIGINRYEWILSYLAVNSGIGISVPLDKGLQYDEFESSLIRSKADVLIFDKRQLAMVEELRDKGNSQVETFICMDEIEGYPSLMQYVLEGKSLLADGYDEYLKAEIDPEALAIILFTSGTTSMSKAVMLSHKNIMSDIWTMLKCEDIRHGDVNMAFLPYHHTFGSTCQILMLVCGSTTTYCDGLKYIQKNIVEYKVSVFVCVPLLIESIYKRIMNTVKKQGLEKKVNFGLKLTKALMKVGIDVRRKVFKDIHEQLGGNLRYVISGASAIDPVALEGFNDFGILAFQGYGMTEASPVLAAENTWHHRTGSIGYSMPDVELAIDEPDANGVGELIARGPNIMLGYYENEEATNEVLRDGWLHTGDLAYVDKDGFVFICGRKKNVIVLKNGKNVFPEELELLISTLPYVEESMVFGQPKRKDSDEDDLAVCVKIVYNPDYMMENYSTKQPEMINEIIKADIDKLNETLPHYKQMLRIITTDEEMIKTTTGKVKRFEEIKIINQQQ